MNYKVADGCLSNMYKELCAVDMSVLPTLNDASNDHTLNVNQFTLLYINK